MRRTGRTIEGEIGRRAGLTVAVTVAVAAEAMQEPESGHIKVTQRVSAGRLGVEKG